MRFEIIKAGGGEWYFRVLAGNGKVLCHSETYTRKRNALKAVGLIRAGAAGAVVEERV